MDLPEEFNNMKVKNLKFEWQPAQKDDEGLMMFRAKKPVKSKASESQQQFDKKTREYRTLKKELEKLEYNYRKLQDNLDQESALKGNNAIQSTFNDDRVL